MSVLIPTEVFDTYWRFAAERMAIYYRRMSSPTGPWTDDPVLRSYRFTNAYRVTDRVSQYLVREVQYRADRSQDPDEVLFRTLLFKLFNRIDTWEMLEGALGPLTWKQARLEAISKLLDRALDQGRRIYSAAYIMPSPTLGHARKHANHLALISAMMNDKVAEQLARARSLRSAYEVILAYPGLGPFLAFQLTVDLNYSTLVNFDEMDFVVAGPGALDGISKCFANAKSVDPVNVIYAMVERQSDEFTRLGLSFAGLFGRKLQPIDCQNLFCEVSKYSRVAHPAIAGSSGRTRIKQRYGGEPNSQYEKPCFPPKWRLNADAPPPTVLRSMQQREQLALL